MVGQAIGRGMGEMFCKCFLTGQLPAEMGHLTFRSARLACAVVPRVWGLAGLPYTSWRQLAIQSGVEFNLPAVNILDRSLSMQCLPISSSADR
jgi:hypothetical protein